MPLAQANQKERYAREWQGTPLTLKAVARELPTLYSIKDFLKWVRFQYPEQMENYTLVRQSLSLQNGTPLAPRAVVFGPDAKFIFTFNESSDSVELILATSNGWELREIEQTPLEGNEKFGIYSPLNSLLTPFVPEKSLTLSPPNPGKCIGCHTASPRPIWEDYPIWKTAYGAHDDLILHDTEEMETFRDFQRKQKQHPRYQWLNPTAESDVAPYSSGPAFNPNYFLRPNLRLTHLLSRYHSKFIATELLKHKDYGKYRHLILASFLGCIAENNASQAMRHLGVSKEKFSLKFSPTNFEYYEGGLDLRDRVVQILYEALAKEEPSLPSLYLRESHDYQLIVRGNSEPDSGSRASACAQLKESALLNGAVFLPIPSPDS